LKIEKILDLPKNGETNAGKAGFYQELRLHRVRAFEPPLVSLALHNPENDPSPESSLMELVCERRTFDDCGSLSGWIAIRFRSID
jgi:hypothetical protein